MKRASVAGAVLLGFCAATLRAETPAQRERERIEKSTSASDEDLLYALGALLGARVQNYGFSPEELARVQRGFADAAARRRLKLGASS